MSINTQRIIGVILFIIGLALGLILNLFASDQYVQVLYKSNRTLILIFTALFIVTGIFLIIFSNSKLKELQTVSNNHDKDDTPLTNKEKEFLIELLEKHHENLKKLLKRKSIYAAGEEPLHLVNQIEAEEEAIKEIEQQLRKLGE